MKRVLWILLVGFLALQQAVSADDDIKVFTTVYPLEFIVERLGGDVVEVESVFPPGADGHNYEPTSQDMIKFAEADVFIYVGETMEVFSTTIANALSNQDVVMIRLEDYPELFQSDFGHDHDNEDDDHDHDHDNHDNHEGHDHGDLGAGTDPHIWIDPLKMIEVSEVVAEALSEEYPEHKGTIDANLEQLHSDLEALDEKFLEKLANKSDGHIVVPHAAYGYWERYGIHQIPVSGFSMSDEPSQKQLINMVSQAREHGLEYVLFEQNTESRIVGVIQSEIGAEAEFIHNLEVRTKEDIEDDLDYIDLMEGNLEVLDKVTE